MKTDTYEQQLDRSNRERKRISEWHRERAREVEAVSEESRRLLADVALDVIGAANRPRVAPVPAPAPPPPTQAAPAAPGRDERARQREIARLRRNLDPETLRAVDRAIEARRIALADVERRRGRRLRSSAVGRRSA